MDCQIDFFFDDSIALNPTSRIFRISPLLLKTHFWKIDSYYEMVECFQMVPTSDQSQMGPSGRVIWGGDDGGLVHSFLL